MKRLQYGHRSHWLVLAGVSSLAMAAQAADPAVQANGVMSFPHVNVVAAPVAQTKAPAAAKASNQAGLLAFIDPATGQLVQPSAEQAAALNPPAPATSLRVAREAQVAANPTFELPQGGVGVMLDDSHASFYVARRADDGSVELVCTPGEHAAKATLKAPRRARLGFAANKGEVK